MYLHLGQNTVIRGDQMIGIFDLENTTVSKITREYLAARQKHGEVVNVSMEIPKSFVVCCDRRKAAKVYVSQISAATLLKRTKADPANL